MDTYITPQTDAPDGTERAADPRQRRFDERGIALQTIIIIVVLLAIAGGVSAALLTRAQSATTQLESQAVSVDLRNIKSKSFCESSGYFWETDGTGAHCEGKPTDQNGNTLTSDYGTELDCLRNGYGWASSACSDSD